MRKLLSILSLILLSVSFAWAQPDVAPIKDVNGKKCYVHKVEKGQTAYGIAKLYKTSVTELFEHNPSAKEGLSIGQELYFPTGELSTTETPVENPVVTNTVTNEPVEGLQKEVVVADTNKIIHTVAAGETMYAIAKKYGVTLEDLQAANLGKVNLKVGEQVVIPVDKANKNNETNPIVKNPINTSVGPRDSVILHTLEAGQTFYFLTKEYGVTEQEIRAANDGLPNGLKKGEIIRIIVPKVGVTEDIQEVLKEVFDSTSRIEEVYDIAIMLPFMLDENEKFRAKCPPVGDCPFYGYTMMAINFERGIMMAIDSLRKAGLNVNVHVYDTEQDTAVLSAILRKPEIKNLDLIFGPLYPKQIKMVADYARANGVQMVVPVPVSNKVLYKNPYVSKFVASTPTQIQYMGKYIAEQFPDGNVIAIKNSANKQDGYYFDEFVKSYNTHIKNQPGRSQDSVRTTKMSSSSKLTAVENYMSEGRNNIIVVPSEDIGHVSNFITKLSGTTNRNPYSKYQVTVFGLEDFMNFETIDEKYKNRYNLHIVASGFIDYHNEDVISFILAHRIKYGIDPDKYTFNGFDAAYTNLKGLLLYGSIYSPNYESIKTSSGYTSGSDYKLVEPGSGYENQAIQILRYNDYRIEVLKP